MTEQLQLQAMPGREGKREVRIRAQIERVRQFKAWLAAGAPLGQMPAVPRDCDFRAYREHRQSGTAA